MSYNWQTDVTSASGIAKDVNIGTTVQTALDSRNRGNGTVLGTGGVSPIRIFGNDSIVGINANSIGRIKEKIQAYIDTIQLEVDKLNTAVDTTKGIKGGEINNALIAYLDKVKEYLDSILTYLKAFSDKLSFCEQNWNAYQESVGRNVSASASAIETKAYTEVNPNSFYGTSGMNQPSMGQPPFDIKTSGPGPVAVPFDQ